MQIDLTPAELTFLKIMLNAAYEQMSPVAHLLPAEEQSAFGQLAHLKIKFDRIKEKE